MFSRWLWRLRWDLWSRLNRTEADSMGSIVLGRLSIVLMILKLIIGVQFLFIKLGIDTFASIFGSLGFGFSCSPLLEETSFIGLKFGLAFGISGLAFGFLYSNEGFELDACCMIGNFGPSS